MSIEWELVFSYGSEHHGQFYRAMIGGQTAWKHVFTPIGCGREAGKQITVYYLDDGREFVSESELLAAMEEAGGNE